MRNTSPLLRLTYRDLLELPEDGLRHELIDGEHYVTPAPGERHQSASFRLSGLLFEYLRRQPIGRAYAAPFDVLLSELDFVEPDLIYLSNERWQRQMNRHRLVGPPDLVVEILSPSTHKIDEGAKLRLYERSGIGEYWLIDPVGETVRVHRLEAGRLQLHAELARERGAPAPVLTTPLLPDFQAPLDCIFA
jgi:Uma2 family endonuclease